MEMIIKPTDKIQMRQHFSFSFFPIKPQLYGFSSQAKTIKFYVPVEKLGHTGDFVGVGRFSGLAGSQWELLDQSWHWCMWRLLGVVNNREPYWSEITQSDTLRPGGQAQQIEMSAISMAGVLQWQHWATHLNMVLRT